MKIRPDKIRDVIGPGGKVIRSIIEETGVKIDVEDDGTVLIASSEGTAMQRAISLIEGITAEPEVGKIYKGIVKKIVDFGVFVEILPNNDGLRIPQSAFRNPQWVAGEARAESMRK